MDCYRLQDVPRGPGERAFRYRWLADLVVTVGFGVPGVAMLAVATGLTSLEAPGLARLVLLFWGGGLALFALLAGRVLKAKLDPAAGWLLKRTPNGLVLHFRSPLNHAALPADDVVAVRIPYHEIEWVRRARERRTTRPMMDDDGPTTRWIHFLDLKVNSPDLGALAGHVAAEANAKAPMRKRWWGGRSTAMVFDHHPLRVLADGVLRLEWQARPRLAKVLRLLGPHLATAPPERLQTDYADTRNLTREARETRFAELAKSGETLAAVGEAADLYGVPLADARRLVREVAEGADPHNPPPPAPDPRAQAEALAALAERGDLMDVKRSLVREHGLSAADAARVGDRAAALPPAKRTRYLAREIKRQRWRAEAG